LLIEKGKEGSPLPPIQTAPCPNTSFGLGEVFGEKSNPSAGVPPTLFQTIGVKDVLVRYT